MAEIPQMFALKAQAACAAGNAPSSSFLEVRALKGGAVRQEFIPMRDLGGVADAVMRFHDDHEVFVGAAPRVRQRGTKADVEWVHELFADCDGEGPSERLHEFDPKPNIIVCTGRPDRHQGHWQINPPIPAAFAERALKRLIHALGSDAACKDASRVLRAIGSINRKHGTERPVECVHLDFAAHSVAAIVGGLPDPCNYSPPPPRLRRGARVRRAGPSKASAGRFARHARRHPGVQGNATRFSTGLPSRSGLGSRRGSSTPHWWKPNCAARRCRPGSQRRKPNGPSAVALTPP